MRNLKRIKQSVIWLLPGLLSLFLHTCQPKWQAEIPTIVSLDQNQWMVSEKDSSVLWPASVPGSVHMDLLANGIIEEPYYRSNEKDLQWIGNRNWIYTTTFDVTDKLLNHDRVSICFDGLDTYADVYLNGKKILEANNYFRSWEKEVKDNLSTGKNTLVVHFKNATDQNRQLLESDSIPLFDDYVYTRKPAFHFGWDWGPVFVTSGIWRPVYLKAWSNGIITDSYIIQEQVSDQIAHLKNEVEVESTTSAKAQLIIECAEADIREVVNVNLVAGTNKISHRFSIDQPQLWWSNGLGDPYLYEIKTSLVSQGKLLDSKKMSVGIRELKLVQNPDETGSSFHFELNGVPVFMKGANYIPQESFQSKVDSADYRKVIQHALDANMNMLRVWGGGFYEEDYFYELCDQHGLLVWQDFMFACSMYPGEEDFLENVRQEAIENVIRLRNHPCLAVWCGNNENYIGWQDWRWSNRYSKEDSAKVWHDYERLFEELLPNVVSHYNSNTPYWPSSPKYGWGYPVNKDGDVHLWAVWHAQDPFEVFLEKENIGRFMSEYGFQSLPEMKTIESFTLPEDHHIDSEVMKNHQKHRIGYPVIDKYLKRDYQWPKDFESYVYLSQVLQAKGIKMAIEAHRRAMPFCMGTLYWQLNDCWPVASWSSVDYYNRWKALHYKVRDAYANMLVSPIVENDSLNVYVVSDLTIAKKGMLEIKLIDFKGQIIWEEKKEIMIPANTSEVTAAYPLAEIVNKYPSNEVVLITEIKDNEKLVSRNELYLARPKELPLKDPHITFDVETIGPDSLKINLRTTYLAKDVFLSFTNADGYFTDNYFDLIPGETKELFFIQQNRSTKNWEPQLHITSLFDTH
jgi:beta-mannosidase